MTSHRCKDGAWRDGKTRDCDVCKQDRKKRGVKRLGES